MISRLAFAMLLTAASASVPAAAATLHGNLALPSVVWVSDGSHPTPDPTEFVMSNRGKTFVPAILVVQAGSSVRFPNDDPFFHSIYSSSTPDPFDIGFYDTGPGKIVTFADPGVVNVRCHIHGSMHATILVVDGPWAETDRENETYDLANVLPGRHVLHVWTPDGGEKTSIVRI